ncbi:MAG: hypothetical protein AAF368_15830 [Planctomycetota bacterium]
MNRLVLTGGLLALTLSSCLSFEYRRDRALEPIDEARLESLQSGSSDLTECLRVLGAPYEVWERPDGFAVVYAFREAHGWSLSGSIDLDPGNASLDYSRAAQDYDGVVLQFDVDAQLVEKRRGLLRDILPEEDERRRPADIADLPPASS